MTKLKFLKMQGIGNDFIMINGSKKMELPYKKLALKLCERHFSIGADGLITVLAPENKKNDFKMRVFNPDGFEAEMCGNGIRCLTHFIRWLDLNKNNSFKIETPAGIIRTDIIKYSNLVSQIRVDMGSPDFSPAAIPVRSSDLDSVINYKLETVERIFYINSVSMGNPHTVIFVDDLNDIFLRKWGKSIENHNFFTDKTNVEFVEIINSAHIKIKVWERGVGRTLGCGTGACASVAVGVKKGLLDKKVSVDLPGGLLKIELIDDRIYMSGEAGIIYQGQVWI